MKEHTRKLVELLRGMESKDAATWLIENYPIDSADWGEAILAISHVSWRMPEQVRLAEYYLQKLPYASDEVYRVFVSFMSIPRLLQILKKYLPREEARKDLLLYHLRPVLWQAAETESERNSVSVFFDLISNN